MSFWNLTDLSELDNPRLIKYFLVVKAKILTINAYFNKNTRSILVLTLFRFLNSMRCKSHRLIERSVQYIALSKGQKLVN